MNRVVVTAVSVMSPIGSGFDRFSDALKKGVRGGNRIRAFDPSGFPTQIAAETDEDFSALKARLQDAPVATDLDVSEDRKSAFGLSAGLACFEAAGRPEGPLGIYLGTGLSSATQRELEIDLLPFVGENGNFDFERFGADFAGLNSPSPTRHLTKEVHRVLFGMIGRSGPSYSNFAACAASSQAIGRAFRHIRAGRLERAIAGGMDSMVHPFGMISFMRLGALSTRNETPQNASRPFDKEREGFLLAEGGAALMLESLGSAQRRGAPILAEITGYGTSIDAHMVTAPHPEGLGAAKAMERALADAALPASAVDYVNAHGTGTPLNDSTESAALRRVFSHLETMPHVSSTKSMTGHLVAAAGALETVACLAALRGGFVPPSVNIETLDPVCNVPVYAASEGMETSLDVVMNNSFGFGGQNSVLILKRYTQD